MTAARTASDAGGALTNASRNALVRPRTLLKTAARTQRSVPSRRAMAASTSMLRGSSTAPSASATCRRTRGSGSSCSGSTASSSAGDAWRRRLRQAHAVLPHARELVAHGSHDVLVAQDAQPVQRPQRMQATGLDSPDAPANVPQLRHGRSAPALDEQPLRRVAATTRWDARGCSRACRWARRRDPRRFERAAGPRRPRGRCVPDRGRP